MRCVSFLEEHLEVALCGQLLELNLAFEHLRLWMVMTGSDMGS